ncbi:hypothetical protein A1O7_10117 [Cladophialophora yegresii CBS 114405]|uniref:Uncharacterized protein n=1 Tax=Cladophialophora yegresii CBS 114405 TaxID=1182544 RepID=W9VRI8_9EURO|nr:uncharacterized protein A1O7_10117 [Cladophialophora yegresii CBS 114405]EXJ54776.1 hypothetical protein A1O7_10117 [Cladophialophora yegresii CBS 114405]
MAHDYQKLQGDVPLEDPTATFRERRARLSWTKTTSLAVLSLTLVITLCVYPVYHIFHLYQSPPAWTDCGSSPSEARSRGCSFDAMSFTWSLSDCFDGELTDQFLSHAQWRWYSEEGTEIDRESVLSGEYEYLFVSGEYHVVHCTFMWRKMHRALLRGRRIDSYLANYNHTEHCAHRLQKQDAAQKDVNTVIVSKYPSCGVH